MIYSRAMTFRSVAVTIAAAVFGLSVLSTHEVAADGAALRVLSSNGMKGAMDELRPQCERAIGRPLALEFNSTASLKKKIETGDAFDVAIITSDAIGELITLGKLAGGSRAELGRSELGIGIRAGVTKPDIRTPETLKRTLHDAQSITYPQDGASRAYVEKMFERMGIAADVKPRIILAQGSGPATESVAAGKAALVITLFSEIVPTHGVEILGPLPGEFHYAIRFAAAASSATKSAEAAKALIAFLAGPQAAPTFKAKGVEPR
jgi:molybdate transport system substrate-binding protein